MVSNRLWTMSRYLSFFVEFQQLIRQTLGSLSGARYALVPRQSCVPLARQTLQSFKVLTLEILKCWMETRRIDLTSPRWFKQYYGLWVSGTEIPYLNKFNEVIRRLVHLITSHFSSYNSSNDGTFRARRCLLQLVQFSRRGVPRVSCANILWFIYLGDVRRNNCRYSRVCIFQFLKSVCKLVALFKWMFYEVVRKRYLIFRTQKQREGPQENTRANQIIVQALGVSDLFRRHHYIFKHFWT